MPDTNTRSIAAVTADMIFAARIRSAAEQAGVAIVFARDPAALRSAAAAADAVILDLDARWLDAPATIRQLKDDAAGRPITCYVSHVRADLIDAARAAGADRVIARSAFVRLLPDILAGH